jgi:hypothetical protein
MRFNPKPLTVEQRKAVEQKIGRRLRSGESTGLIYDRKNDVHHDDLVQHRIYMSRTSKPVPPLKPEDIERAKLEASLKVVEDHAEQKRYDALSMTDKMIHDKRKALADFDAKQAEKPLNQQRLKVFEPLHSEIAWNHTYSQLQWATVERMQHALELDDHSRFDSELKSLRESISNMSAKEIDGTREALGRQIEVRAQKEKLFGLTEPPKPQPADTSNLSNDPLWNQLQELGRSIQSAEAALES